MIAEQLLELGFVSLVDFVCQDDTDGHGPYIREWLSEQACPFPDQIRDPIEPVAPKKK